MAAVHFKPVPIGAILGDLDGTRPAIAQPVSTFDVLLRNGWRTVGEPLSAAAAKAVRGPISGVITHTQLTRHMVVAQRDI